MGKKDKIHAISVNKSHAILGKKKLFQKNRDKSKTKKEWEGGSKGLQGHISIHTAFYFAAFMILKYQQETSSPV